MAIHEETRPETNRAEFPITLSGIASTHNKDEPMIADAVTTLRRQGWCFVNVDARVQFEGTSSKYDFIFTPFWTSMITIIDAYQEFFAQDEAYKRQFSCAEHFGYNSTHVREGMRVVTGQYSALFDAPAMNHMSQLDKTMLSIMTNLSPSLFGCDADEALKATDSCLQVGQPRNWMDQPPHVSGYGMFDVVRYYNDPERNVDGLEQNVPGHNDPGILSFSMTSDETGLQLYDPESDAWVDCPLGVGVLWCGNAAHELNADVPAARHRVLFAERPRMSMWYEICAGHQVPGVIKEQGLVAVDESMEDSFERVRVARKTASSETFSIFVRSTGKHSEYQSKRLRLDNLTPNMTVNDMLIKFEFKTGSPFSKSRPQRTHHASLIDIASGEALYMRDQTLAECGLEEGSVVFMDWD